MGGSVPSWLTVVQCLVAGVLVGLVAMEAGAWRGVLRREHGRWASAWSLALAGVCLLNGVYGLLAPGSGSRAVLFARFVAYAAAVVLALPAVRACAGGPRVRVIGPALLAWFAAAGVLWWTTPLLVTEIHADGLPEYGPLLPLVELAPLALIGGYVLRVLARREVTTAGAYAAGGAIAAVAALVAGTVAPPSAATELLRGLWVVPLVTGVEALAVSRIRAVRHAAERRSRMRDAIASVSNAAWLAHTPAELLETARTQCEELLGDPSIRGTLRPLSRDRFVTEFYSAEGRTLHPDEQSFLRDVARVVSSAAERHTLTGKLREAAFTDALTGLHNRPALDRRLAALLGKAEVELTRVGVLFCDLDGFKHANDVRGREWGDRLLSRVATQLVDVAGPGAFVARHGGDDFVVVIDRAPDDAELLALARRVHHRFEYLSHRMPATPLTVGVAAWRPGEVRDVDALIRGADHAMMAAKREGKGAAFYDERLRGEFHEQITMRRELEDAIANGDLVVHFQPLTRAETLEVVGLEALARWRRHGELVLPQEWLPLAEETGLIVEIGRQVFAAARAASEKYDLPVAVNVAARQLDEADFVRHVEQSWGPGAWRRLTIEVTESALLHDDEHARAALATLAARGARIALDDFGTGYNSLSRLADLPVHVLKVDKSFVQASGTPAGDAVLRAVLAVARAHGLDVVAEGVERAEELTALVEMGVETVQGFMLGRPAPTLPIRGPRPKTGEIPVATATSLPPHRLSQPLAPAARS